MMQRVIGERECGGCGSCRVVEVDRVSWGVGVEVLKLRCGYCGKTWRQGVKASGAAADEERESGEGAYQERRATRCAEVLQQGERAGETCGGAMWVRRTKKSGSVVVRYLKCQECGATDKSAV